MKTKNQMLEKAKNAKKESKYIEFKERFDVTSSQDWPEIIKDVVAMANSGGGVILIGVRNNGTPSGFDATPVLSLDPANLTDKIAKYTGEQFSEFEITEIDKDGHKVAVLQIYGVRTPMIFIQHGTYDIGGGKQRAAFGRGALYFRHGAKSEPGNSNDLRKVIERELENIRKSWLGNIRKVVKAPIGHHVKVLPANVVESTLPTATPIRIVEDPNAPPYQKIDPDRTHPYRQKEVMQLVNQRLGGRKTINSYDVHCVRRIYEIDKTKPQYYYKSKFASPQYSDAFVDWLVNQFEKAPSFFDNVRQKYKGEHHA